MSGQPLPDEAGSGICELSVAIVPGVGLDGLDAAQEQHGISLAEGEGLPVSCRGLEFAKASTNKRSGQNPWEFSMAGLPYITAPGNIEKALNAIKSAQTPQRVTQDFVKTILKIKGGSGDQVASYLKKIGFVNSDGTPSPIYSRFRNSNTSGTAAMEALKHGYAPLFKRNEFMHELDDKALKGLIIEETGEGADSSVPGLILSSINALRKYAKEVPSKSEEHDSPAKRKKPSQSDQEGSPSAGAIGMNLSYTINLNLPATTDVAVFNAIFKSLKEHLLRDTSGQ